MKEVYKVKMSERVVFGFRYHFYSYVGILDNEKVAKLDKIFFKEVEMKEKEKMK